MAPHAENQRMCSSEGMKKIQNEIREKLKLEEEKERRKQEKEAKRRAELEKMKKESLVRHAELLVPMKKEKQPVQSKKPSMNSQLKTSKEKKQRFHNLENKNFQGFSNEPKASAWTKKQPEHSEGRFRNDSFSSEKSWKSSQSSSRHASVSDVVWNNKNEYFPALGAEAPIPDVNVWVERKCKQDEIRALEPRNKYDEEAMLQEALALSMMEATREEEQKRKLEEEYRLQIEALKCNPENMDEFKLDELSVSYKSNLESHNASESAKEEPQYESFSRNAALSSIIQKSKPPNPGGARPKLNKIIDKFGGWGIKDTKKDSNSLSNVVNDSDEKSSKKTWNYNPSTNFQKSMTNNGTPKSVSNWDMLDTKIEKPVVSDSRSNGFNNDVRKLPASDPWENDVDEKSPKKTWKYNRSADFQKNMNNNNTKTSENVSNLGMSDTKIEKPVVSDSWSNGFNNDAQKLTASDPWENEVLDNENETSFDVTEVVNSGYLNSTTDCYGSSKEKEYFKDKICDNVTDKCLSSADEPAPISNQWDDVFSDEKPIEPNATTKRSSSYLVNSSLNKTETKHGNAVNFEAVVSVEDKFDENSSNGHDSLDVLSKSSVTKDMPTDSFRIKKEKELFNSNIFSQSESTHNYVVVDSGQSKDGADPSRIFLSTSDICSDKSSSESTASNSTLQNQNFLQAEYPGEEAPFKFGTVEESGNLLSNKENDTFIAPPHPVSVVPETNKSNQTFTTEISGDECTEKLPPILPPQALPQMPSQYLFNPAMFPGINPMFGLGMDPIMMRQMLMISNPFFASQLLAMEQYYRAMGMNVDLLSFPAQPVPNMPFPGIASTLGQNAVPNPINVNDLSAHNSLQNQYHNQNVLSENPNSVSLEQHSTKHPSVLDKNACDAIENDPFYPSVLSNDTESVIPPPKPPVNTNDKIPSTFIPQPSETSESASSISYNMNLNDFVSSNPPSNLLKDKSSKCVSVVEACTTKAEVTGWGDLDDNSSNKSKTNSWDDDYGWGTDNLPAKSVRNPSVYEDKKTVHRQPSRQPRFQRNRYK